MYIIIWWNLFRCNFTNDVNLKLKIIFGFFKMDVYRVQMKTVKRCFFYNDCDSNVFDCFNNIKMESSNQWPIQLCHPGDGARFQRMSVNNARVPRQMPNAHVHDVNRQIWRGNRNRCVRIPMAIDLPACERVLFENK